MKTQIKVSKNVTLDLDILEKINSMALKENKAFSAVLNELLRKCIKEQKTLDEVFKEVAEHE